MADRVDSRPKFKSFAPGISEKDQPGNAFTWTAVDERALRPKIDLGVFPVLIILFILNFIDHNNFANARLRGQKRTSALPACSTKRAFPFS